MGPLTTIDTIDGVHPTGVAVDPAGGALYAVNGTDGAVSVIDTSTHKVIDTITVRPSQWSGGIAVDPAANAVYVITRGFEVIDMSTHQVIDSIDAGGGSFLAVDPSTGVVYEPNSDMEYVTAFTSTSNEPTAKSAT